MQAVTIAVGQLSNGTLPYTLDAHPGALYTSQINTPQICATDETITCWAEAAGLYNPDSSYTAAPNATTNNTADFITWNWRGEVAHPRDYSERNLMDSLAMTTSAGLILIPNTAVNAMDMSNYHLPGGPVYATQVSHFSLGGPRSSELKFNETNFASTFAGALYENDTIPSNTFGLHLGSASLNLVGSLT